MSYGSNRGGRGGSNRGGRGGGSQDGGGLISGMFYHKNEFGEFWTGTAMCDIRKGENIKLAPLSQDKIREMEDDRKSVPDFWLSIIEEQRNDSRGGGRDDRGDDRGRGRDDDRRDDRGSGRSGGSGGRSYGGRR